MTDIELRNENGKIVGYDSDGNKVPVSFEDAEADSFSADVATVNQKATIYVRSDGDDSNDGLSVASPKATIQGALSDAPVPQPSSALVIDVGSGVFTGKLSIRADNVGSVKISGATSNGNPDTTLDADGDPSVISVLGPTRVDLENLTLQNAIGWNLDAQFGASVGAENCEFIDGADRNAYIQAGSDFESDSDCVFDITGASGPVNNVEVTGEATAYLSGEIIGGGSTGILRAKQNSWVFARGSLTIDGNGSGQYAVFTTDNVDTKLGGGITIQNAGGIADVRRNGTIKASGSINTSSLSDDWSIGRNSHLLDEAGERVQSITKNPSTPSNLTPKDGNEHFETTNGVVEVYSEGRSAWVESGKEVGVQGTVSVPAGGTARVPLSDAGHKVVAWEPRGTQGTVEISEYRQIDGGTEYAVFEESTGNDSVTISLRIHIFARTDV